jgi:uncharacterized protein YdaU (DUF1376 family)
MFFNEGEAMAKAWMPFYVGDYMADTGGLDNAAHGSYVLCLLHLWTTGEALPDPSTSTANAEILQMICKSMSSTNFEHVWSKIQRFFYHDGIGYRNHRIDKELKKTDEISKKRTDAASSRYKKKEIVVPDEVLEPAANAVQLETHSPSHSHSPQEDKKKRSTDFVPPYRDILDAFNKFCPSFSRALELTETRKSAIRLRWIKYQDNDGGPLKVFDTLFKKAESSDFLTGRDGKWSGKRGVDWLLNAANMVKVLEGNYDNRGELDGKPGRGSA